MFTLSEIRYKSMHLDNENLACDKSRLMYTDNPQMTDEEYELRTDEEYELRTNEEYEFNSCF